MQTTSATWKSLWASGEAMLETRAIIADVAYTQMTSPTISRALTQDGLSIGNAVAASCQFSVLADAAAIPKAAPVRIEMRLRNGNSASEWLSAGTFYISHRSYDPVSGVLTVECFDALLRANADAPNGSGIWVTDQGVEVVTNAGENIVFGFDYPQTTGDMVAKIAALLGVTPDPRNVIASGTIEAPANGTTLQDILKKIGTLNGGNWIISPANQLRLVPVVSAANAASASGNVVDLLGITQGISARSVRTITGVRYTDPEAGTTQVIGTEQGLVVSAGEVTAAQAQAIYNRLQGMLYQAYALSGAIYDPAAELGDYVRGGANGEIRSVLYSETAVFSELFHADISAPESGELADEYPYLGASAKALNEALNEAKNFAEDAASQAEANANAYADSVASGLDESLNQQAIFNRLTNNGQAQGMFLDNGNVYFNATYIRTGTLAADRIGAGTIVVSKLSPTVQESLTRIDDLAVGGRNLASGTSVTKVLAPTGAETFCRPIIYPTTNYGMQMLGLAENTEFTLSFDWVATGADTAVEASPALRQTSAGNYGFGNLDSFLISTGTSSGHYSCTFEPTSGQRTYGTQWLIANIGSNNRNLQITISNFMFEVGNTPTSWSPAPEDLALTSQAAERQHYIYISASSALPIPSLPTAWVTESQNIQTTWTTTRPQYDSAYPVLFVALQRQAVDGAISCTTPVVDQTTTVIDGGHITTGTLDAGVANIININASNINTGTLNADLVQVYSQNDDSLLYQPYSKINKASLAFGVIGKLLPTDDLEDIGITSRIREYFTTKYNSTSGKYDLLDEHNLEILADRAFIGISKITLTTTRSYGAKTEMVLDSSAGITAQMYSGPFAITGDFTVSGTKSRVVDADQYSDRLFYAYETASPMFGDVGEGVIGDDGRCYIFLDPIFAQAVESDRYQVFLQAYGYGRCYVLERHPSYFIVAGLSEMAFGWEVKARQKGYEAQRLESAAPPFSVPQENYGDAAADHIENLQKGMIL